MGAVLRRVLGYWRNAPLTWALFWTFTAIWLVEVALHYTGHEALRLAIFQLDGNWPSHSTSLFLHHYAHQVGEWHYVSNAGMTLAMFPAVERGIGWRWTFILFNLGAQLASALKLGLSGIPSIGASGGLLTIFPVMMVLWLQSMPGDGPKWLRHTAWFGPALLLYSGLNPAIAIQFGHVAHWAGFLAGTIYATSLVLRQYLPGWKPPTTLWARVPRAPGVSAAAGSAEAARKA